MNSPIAAERRQHIAAGVSPQNRFDNSVSREAATDNANHKSAVADQRCKTHWSSKEAPT
jgi:hypothetical protein